VATRFIRWLSWLWFVPRGETETGLAFLEEVRTKGGVFGFDAGVELALIYLYMEDEPDLAEPIVMDLLSRHPQNSYLRFEIVELNMIRGDHVGTIEAALALEQQTGRQFGDERRRRMARIWRARAELMRGQPDQAEEIIAPLEAQWDELGAWSQRWLSLTRANLYDLAGEREKAVEIYRQAAKTSKKSRFGSRRTVRLSKEWLDEPFQLPAEDVRAVSAAPTR